MVELKERKLTLRMNDNDTLKWEHEGKRYCLHVQQDEHPDDPREMGDNIDIMACWHRNYRLGDKIDAKNPEDFWRGLVRENVSYAEIYAAAEAGKLYGIRLAPNKEDPEGVDVYETYYLRTVIGNSEPSECLEYECLSKDGVVEYIMDDLTVRHCQTLMEPYAEWLPLWLYDHGGITMSCGTRTGQYADRWDSGQVGWIIALKKTIMSEMCVGEDEWRERAVSHMEAVVKEYDQYLTGDTYGFTLYVEDPEVEERDGNTEWQEVDSCWNFFGDDIMENGIVDSIGFGLLEAIQKGEYEEGRATLNTVRFYTF